MKQIVSAGCGILMGLSGIFQANASARIDNAISGVNGTVVTFSADQYRMSPVNINGDAFSQLRIEGRYSYSSVKGAPELPYEVARIVIGDNTSPRLETVQVHSHLVENIGINPSKGPAFSAEELAAIPYTFGDVYQQDAFYPTDPVTAGSPFIMRDVRGVALKYYPFQYNPVKRQLKVIDSITVSVVEDAVANAPNPKCGITRGRSADFERIYKDAFLNYGGSGKFRSATTPVPDGEKMVVIAPTKFMDALKPYVEWKNRKGIHCELIEYTGVNTTVTGARKDTSIIKDIIKNKYAEGVSYFLLAGGDVSIPSLWEDQFPGPPKSGQPDSLGTQSGTDDPRYVMLDGDDYYPDAFIGRFPSDSLPRMQAMVNKAINYEMYPDTTGTWNSRAIGFASAKIDSTTMVYDYQWCQETLDTLAAHTYTDIVKVFDYPTPATVPQAYSALNAGASWVNYISDAGVYNWATPTISTHDIDTLKNGAKLPIVICLGCETGIINQPYQSYPITGIWDRCMAEAFMWNPNGGGIVYLGGTTLMPWTEPITAFRDMTTLQAQGDYRSIGAIIANGETNMLSAAENSVASDPKSIRDLHNMTALIWATYGDPSLTPFSATPNQLVLSYPAQISSSFTVSGPAGALVCIYSPTDSFLSAQVITGSSVTFDISTCTAETVYVTGTEHNMVPYLGSINCSGNVPICNAGNAKHFVNRIGMVSREHIQAELTSEGSYDFCVYSMDGRKVFGQSAAMRSGVQNLAWNGRSLARGTYVLNIKGCGAALNKRFVIM